MEQKLSQSHIKRINALRLKKYRQKYQNFIVEGEKSVLEALSQSKIPVELLAVTDEMDISDALSLHPNAELIRLKSFELEKISTLSTPNKALAILALPDTTPDFEAAQTGCCFYLDRLQDPGNVGTILRIADWFGMSAIYCSEGTVDVFSPKVIQACMGAFLRVKIFQVADNASIPKEIPIFGASMEGESLMAATQLPKYGLLALGNEGQGIAPDLAKRVQRHFSVPKGANGGAESLNVGVAAGIFAAVFSEKNRSNL